VPGHFHIAVGTVTAMTFMGIALWMLPHLTGRALISTPLAQTSVWLWFIGMSIFSLGMHWAGLYGVPRRAWVSSLPQSAFERVYGLAHLPLTFVAVGGVVLWLATLAFYIVFFGSLFTRRLPASPQIPFAQALVVDSSPPVVTRAVEHLGLLTVFTLITTIVVYLPILWPLVQHTTSAHGWKVW
jgi:cytochrome c oxidase subunit 1